MLDEAIVEDLSCVVGDESIAQSVERCNQPKRHRHERKQWMPSDLGAVFGACGSSARDDSVSCGCFFAVSFAVRRDATTGPNDLSGSPCAVFSGHRVSVVKRRFFQFNYAGTSGTTKTRAAACDGVNGFTGYLFL